MIELDSEKSTITVTVTAMIPVTRAVTVEAFGEGHAREVAYASALNDPEPHVWTYGNADDGVEITVDPKLLDASTVKRR